MASSAVVVPTDDTPIPADVDGPPPPGWTPPTRPVVVTTPATASSAPPRSAPATSQSTAGSQGALEHRVVIEVTPTQRQESRRQDSFALYDYHWSGPSEVVAEDELAGLPMDEIAEPSRKERKKNAPPFEPLRLKVITRRGIRLHCHEGRLMGCLRFILSAAGAVCSAIIWIVMLKAKQTDLRWNNIAAFVALVTINVATTFWCVIHIPINLTYLIKREHPCGICCGWFAFLVDAAIAVLSFAAASASVGVVQYQRLPGGICEDYTTSVDKRRFCTRTAGATGFAFITWAGILLPLAFLSSCSLGRKYNMRLVKYPTGEVELEEEE